MINFLAWIIRFALVIIPVSCGLLTGWLEYTYADNFSALTVVVALVSGFVTFFFSLVVFVLACEYYEYNRAKKCENAGNNTS